MSGSPLNTMSIRSRDSSANRRPPVRTMRLGGLVGALPHVTVGRFDQLIRRGPFASYERIAQRDQIQGGLCGRRLPPEDAGGVGDEQSR